MSNNSIRRVVCDTAALDDDWFVDPPPAARRLDCDDSSGAVSPATAEACEGLAAATSAGNDCDDTSAKCWRFGYTTLDGFWAVSWWEKKLFTEEQARAAIVEHHGIPDEEIKSC